MIFSSYLINKRLKLRETLCYSVVNLVVDYDRFYPIPLSVLYHGRGAAEKEPQPDKECSR